MATDPGMLQSWYADYQKDNGTASTTAAPAAAPAPTGKTSPVQGLQERFTFETFVPGPANEFAHAVARRIANWADGHFNPVLFHGPYGFGKTHLLNALAWEAMRNAPEKRVVYLTAERFLSTFVRALMDRQTAAFKEELRAADLLIIDDFLTVSIDPEAGNDLFAILANRNERLATIIASQTGPAHWVDALPDRVAADSIVDRLAHHARRIELGGIDMRKACHDQTRTSEQFWE